MKPFISIFFIVLLTIPLLSNMACTVHAAEPIVTEVSGTVSKDTTWSGNILVKRPGVSVVPSVTLKIEPATTVSFEHARRGTKAGLYVYGTLIATGTADKPIRFTSDAAQPEHGDWQAITLYPGSAGSVIDHCIIEYASAAVYVQDNITLSNSILRWTTGCALPVFSTCTITRNRIYETGNNLIEVHYHAEPIITYNLLWGCTQVAGIHVECYSHPIIRYNTIMANREAGIKILWSSSATIEYNTIIRNRGEGICLERDSLASETVIRYNNIYDNEGLEMGVWKAENVTAISNWWGTTDEEMIEAEVAYRLPSGESVPTILYKPYLASEVDIGEVVYDFENNEVYTHLPKTENDIYAYIFSDDDETRTVVDSLTPPGNLTLCGVAWDGESLRVLTVDSVVYKLSESGSVLSSFHSGATQPMGMAFDGQSLWVLDYTEGLVYHFDLLGRLINSIPAPCAEPQGLTYDGEYLWTFTNQITGKAYQFDTSGNVIRTLQTNGYSGLAWDGKYLWINQPGLQEIYQIDPSNGHVVRVITSSGVNTQYLTWQEPYLWAVEWGDEIPEHNRLVKLLPTKERITLDGLKDDWQGFTPLLRDPQGDAVGERTDIKAIYGFTDERYVYLMVEFYELARYHHVDIYVDFNGDGNPEYAVYGFVPGRPEYAVHLRDYLRGETRIGEFEIGYRKSELGCNAKEILELKAPLRFFDNKTEFYLRCSLMGQLDGKSYAIDETDWTRIRSLYAAPEKPAEFKVTDLSISPTEAEVKQTITISVKVTNIGEQKGSYSVDLKVAGATVDTRTVTLSGGESTTVTFELAKEEAGTFDVEVSGLRGAFVVKETPPPPPWELYATMAAVIIIVAMGIVTIIYMRKRISTH